MESKTEYYYEAELDKKKRYEGNDNTAEGSQPTARQFKHGNFEGASVFPLYPTVVTGMDQLD